MCYGDEILIINCDEHSVDDLTRTTSHTLKTKNLGRSNRFLRINFILSSENDLVLHQTKLLKFLFAGMSME